MKWLALGFVLLLGAGANGGGCSNPNAVGVQDYGSVVGRVLDATNNRPVPGALVAVGSLYTGTADPRGGFTLGPVPIGVQQLSATAPGYQTTTVPVTVHKNVTSDAGYVRITPVSATFTAPPPPTPQPPNPIPTAVPALTPQPGVSSAPTSKPQ